MESLSSIPLIPIISYLHKGCYYGPIVTYAVFYASFNTLLKKITFLNFIMAGL